MLTIRFVINVSYHYKCCFVALGNTQNAHTILQLHNTYSFFALCAEFQLVRKPTEFCLSVSGPATRGHGTFEMLIYLVSAERAIFPQEHAAQTPSLKRNITHTIAGGLAMFISSERADWGKRLRPSRETGKTGKNEIQGPNNTRNARYRDRTSRKTGDGGTKHHGKHGIQKRDVARIVTHRNGHSWQAPGKDNGHTLTCCSFRTAQSIHVLITVQVPGNWCSVVSRLRHVLFSTASRPPLGRVLDNKFSTSRSFAQGTVIEF
jgi:hypothetical protein